MERKGVIYKIENLINGKVYIGQTVRDVKRRLQCHKIKLQKEYHNNAHLQHAWNKYGEENFKSSIVETCTIDNIDDREKYWIKYYKELGMSYNIEDGGNYIKIIPLETRKKISIKSKEAWANESIRYKIIRNLKRGKDNPSSKSIICINDMNIFDTITEASKYYNVKRKAISQTLSGRNPHCNSYDGKLKLEFDYYIEGKKYFPKNHIHAQSKKVICVTTGEIFDSISIASKKYCIPTTNISKVCKKQRKTAGKLQNGTKLKWAYE